MWRAESDFAAESFARYLRLESSSGPRDERRAQEDQSATECQTLSARFCETVLGDPAMRDRWLCGIQRECAGSPPIVVLPDHPPALAEQEKSGLGLDRLAPLGEIYWRSDGSYPPDLRVRPSHWIVEADKVRVVRERPNVLYPLNSMLADPPVDYGPMGGFLSLRKPGAYMGGIDLQDCRLHWLVAPSCRRYLRVRRPAAGILGVYLSLPFGLGPSPGWNDACVKAVLSVARPRFPLLRIVDFAGNLRRADESDERDALAAGAAGALTLLKDIEVSFRTKEGKRLWPTRRAPWLGFEVDTF